jgi:Fe-S-cluster-containing hydrogenase component 2
VGCPVGAIYRDYSGEVAHKKNCIACGNCARRCPYGNIKIVPRSKDGALSLFNIVNNRFKFFDKDNKKRGYPVKIVGKQNREVQEKKEGRDPKIRKNLIAAKCDNCKNFQKMGCVQNCPRAAAIKVRPGKYFKQLKSG